MRTARYRDEIVALSAPLDDAGDLDVLIDRIGAARVVMLGEASHGTHEFYRWRAHLMQRLIAERGFSFVAVEDDWPDCERVDHSVRGRPGAPEDPRAALAEFDRWPTWLWANEEVADFCRWLRGHNAVLPHEDRVGFHGLDVYSLWESLRAILTHLTEHRLVPTSCENEVVDLLVRLREKGRFDTRQHAEVVAGAERYYRTMIGGGRESWNVRDRHMADTLDRLLTHYGPEAKGVVWAHNTHVGDARATSMAANGEINIGQLARERHGTDDVVLVGFGCHRGTVVAGQAWGAPERTMPVPPARPGSVEDAMHAAAPERALFVFPAADWPDVLTDELGHRAVGVVYHPERERWGNYVPTVLGDRYDAFLWFEETRALHALALRRQPS